MLLARASFASPRLWAPPLMLLLGCASRDVPSRFPESSAASLAAPAGASLPVTHALASEPPMPGSQAPGWQGLNESTTAPNTEAPADPHAQHRGHHGN